MIQSRLVSSREPAPQSQSFAMLLTATLSSIQQLTDDYHKHIGEINARLAQLEQHIQSLSAAPGLPTVLDPSSRCVFVRLLGPFQVLAGQQPLPLPRYGRTSAVLRYLALHYDRLVTRDRLREVVWPEGSPEQSVQSLNTTISALRNALGCVGAPDAIRFEVGSYRLNRDVGILVDLALFETYYQQGKQRENNGDQEGAMAYYADAIMLYQGDLCLDDLCDDGILIERERVAALYVTLLSKLAKDAYMQARYEECLVYSFRLLQRDPCHEDMHQLLMCCYMRLGHRALALRQYELCATLLERELNLPPGAATILLYERIRSGSNV